MKKIWTGIKWLATQAKDGARKPLPLVGIVTAVKEAKQTKQYVKFAFYIATGLYTAFLLYKGLDATEALDFITSILKLVG